MTAPNLIVTDQQRLAVGTVVSLYTIDATARGGSVYAFTPGPVNGQAAVYQGVTYAPLPIRITGVKAGGEGAVARPTLTASALDERLLAAVMQTDDLRGATATRLRTLTQYLDGETTADPDRHWPAEIWHIEQLIKRDKTEVVWRLASAIDFDRKKLPGRQVLRDVCAWRYRRWTGTRWDYTRAECPYTGTSFFDAEGNAVTAPDKDRCSRRVDGCRLRFPDQPLPFGGFIGVARVRQR